MVMAVKRVIKFSDGLILTDVSNAKSRQDAIDMFRKSMKRKQRIIRVKRSIVTRNKKLVRSKNQYTIVHKAKRAKK